MGCITKEKAAIGLGTTATVTFTVPYYLEPERFIPPYDSIMKGYFSPEIEIFRGYWLISWFKKEFAEKEMVQAKKEGVSAEELLNRRLEEIPPRMRRTAVSAVFYAQYHNACPPGGQ